MEDEKLKNLAADLDMLIDTYGFGAEFSREDLSTHFRNKDELDFKMALLLEKRDKLSAEEMEQIAECWRLRKDYEKCAAWSDRLFLVYPRSLEAYATRLKLLYETEDRSRFFETLDEMKKTGIPLDHEMMEMVRIFI